MSTHELPSTLPTTMLSIELPLYKGFEHTVAKLAPPGHGKVPCAPEQSNRS